MRHRLHRDIAFAVQCVAQLIGATPARVGTDSAAKGCRPRNPGRAIPVLRRPGGVARARQLFVGKTRRLRVGNEGRDVCHASGTG